MRIAAAVNTYKVSRHCSEPLLNSTTDRQTQFISFQDNVDKNSNCQKRHMRRERIRVHAIHGGVGRAAGRVNSSLLTC